MATVGSEAVAALALKYVFPTKIEAHKPGVLFKLKKRSGKAPDCRCGTLHAAAGQPGRRQVRPRKFKEGTHANCPLSRKEPGS